MRTLAAILLALSLAGCARFSDHCAECGRDECRNLAVSVYRADGAVERMCCPRCALRGIAKAKRPISRIEVTSFDEAKPLAAEHAFYVEGSDVHPCARPVGSAPVTDERGCCLKPVYDRCEPSLVAFADEAAASSFAREHGGFVKTWNDVGAEER